MSPRFPLTVIDGAVGTEMMSRGIACEGPSWNANAVANDRQTIAEIHRDYADAGARIHTAATFRTTPRYVGEQATSLTETAIRLARQSVPRSHQIAGSLAPTRDCYRPDQSPPNTAREHYETAQRLAGAGCDFILCETFANPSEAIVALDAALETGLPVWLSLTAGPDGNLMTPKVMGQTAKQAVDHGVDAMLVNCVAASRMGRFVSAISDAVAGQIAIGAYANIGTTQEGLPTRIPDRQPAHLDDNFAGDSAGPEPWSKLGPWSKPDFVDRYARFAREWIASGATILGGCCGTDPETIRVISRLIAERGP